MEREDDRRAGNREKTLREIAVRDLWQKELISHDGTSVGHVVRQIIEPRLYTVRYLIVYASRPDRHYLVPADSIIDITDVGVFCNLTSSQLDGLPVFHFDMNRAFEERIYASVARTPYWIEEQPWIEFERSPE